MPNPSSIAMNDEWYDDPPSVGDKIGVLIQARSLVKDVRLQADPDSQVHKACSAAELAIELAWKMIEDDGIRSDEAT